MASSVQPGRTGEIVSHSERRERGEVGREGKVAIVLYPCGDGEDVLLLEEIANLLFLMLLARHLCRLVFGQRQLRQFGIAFFLVGLEGNRAFPFLAAHAQQLLRGVRDQGHMLQEEDIVVTSDSHIAGHPRQPLLQPAPIAFQCPDRILNRGIKLGGASRCKKGFQLTRHFLQPGTNVIQLMDG